MADPIKQMQQQAQQAKTEVRTWKAKQSQAIETEAERLRREQTDVASRIEKQSQETLEAIRIQEARAKRAKEIPGIVIAKPRVGVAKEVEKARKEAIQKTIKGKEQLKEAKEEALEEVATITKEALVDIGKQEQAAVTEYKAEVTRVEAINKARQEEFDKKYIQTGKKDEYISREYYNSLSKDDQRYITKFSLNTFNKHLKRQWEKDKVELKSGEWINKTEYQALEPTLQTELSNRGIEGFNKWADKQVKTYEASIVTLPSGEVVDKKWYDSLDTGDRVGLNQLGLTEWTRRINRDVADFKKKNIQLDIGEYVDKQFYNDLNKEEKDYINKLGVDKYTKHYYKELPSKELIKRDAFYAMTKDEQVKLKELGIVDYNKYVEKTMAEQKKEAARIVATTIELNTGELVTKDSYNSLSVNDQKLLKAVGTVQFNETKDQELQNYITSLPQTTQNWINRHSIESFNTWLEKANKETPERAFTINKQLGLLPEDAMFAGVDNKGEVQYSLPPTSAKNAKVIDLADIDYDKLTEQDYWNIALTVSKISKYKVMETSGIPGVKTKPSLEFSLLLYAKSLPKEQKDALSKLASKISREQQIDIISWVFPPAQALKADVTLADITATDWAIGAASVALIVAAPVLGVIGKAAGVVGKTALIAGKTIQLGAVATFSAVTAVEWKNMTPTGRAISVALNIAIVGALYGRTIVSGLRSLATKVKGTLPDTAKYISQLSKAVKAGNATQIKAISAKLEKVSAELAKTNPIEGKILQEQAKFFNKNASALAKQKVTLPKESVSILDKITKQIKTIAKSEVGELRLAPKVKEAAETWVRRGVITKGAAEVGMTEAEFTRFIQARVINPKLTPLGFKISEIKLSSAYEIAKQQRIKAAFETIEKAIVKSKLPKVAEIVKAKIKISPKPIKLKVTAPVSKVELAKIRQGKINEAVESIVKGKDSPLLQKAKLGMLTASEQKVALEMVTKQLLAKAEAIIVQLKVITPNKAIAQLLQENLVTVAIATNALAVTNTIANANAKAQTQILAAVSPAIAQAIRQAIDVRASVATKTNSIAKAQTLAMSEVATATKAMAEAAAETATKAQAITKTITSTATEAATKAMAEEATATQVKQAVVETVDTLVKQITEPAVKTVVKAKVSEIVDAIVKQIPIVKPPPKIKPPPKVWIPPIITLPDGTEKKMTEEEFASAVGWKQGFMYIMIFKPYKQNNVTFTRKPIPGIPYKVGARSAYESIRKLKDGKLPAKVKIDLGIMDVIVETEKAGRGKPKIRFKRDIEQISSKGVSTAR